MGLETVLEEILAQGATEERALLASAEAERQKVLDEAEGRADELRSRKLAESQARIEALRREILSASEFESRRKLLVARRELLEDFRTRVLQALSALPKAENESLLGALAKQARATLPKGVVHARAVDLPLLAKSGYQAGPAIACAGGLQVESPDGTIVLDLRYETLLERLWKDLLNAHRSLFEV